MLLILFLLLQLVIDFEKFMDPDIADLTQAQNAIAGYQYALTDNTLDSKLLQDWQNVVVSPINSTFVSNLQCKL